MKRPEQQAVGQSGRQAVSHTDSQMSRQFRQAVRQALRQAVRQASKLSGSM